MKTIHLKELWAFTRASLILGAQSCPSHSAQSVFLCIDHSAAAHPFGDAHEFDVADVAAPSEGSAGRALLLPCLEEESLSNSFNN